jgi:hypothetical protein
MLPHANSYMRGVTEGDFDKVLVELKPIPYHSFRWDNRQNVRFEVFTAVTMKNAVFWDIITEFLPQRKHITSPLKSPAG